MFGSLSDSRFHRPAMRTGTANADAANTGATNLDAANADGTNADATHAGATHAGATKTRTMKAGRRSVRLWHAAYTLPRDGIAWNPWRALELSGSDRITVERQRFSDDRAAASPVAPVTLSLLAHVAFLMAFILFLPIRAELPDSAGGADITMMFEPAPAKLSSPPAPPQRRRPQRRRPERRRLTRHRWHRHLSPRSRHPPRMTLSPSPPNQALRRRQPNRHRRPWPNRP